MYIELAGSHADKEKDTATSQLLSSLIKARHPLDQKMENAELYLTEGGAPLLGGVEGVRRRAVPEEEGGSESEGEGDIETLSDPETSSNEDLGESTANGEKRRNLLCVSLQGL